MNIAAYCRVSTNTDDQMNSLDTQKKFFSEFADKYDHNLVKIYADEGISGTKLNKRKEFLQLMSDAEKGIFDMVVVKDISRFARNAVDFLQSIRKLKSMGIACSFVNANLTSQDGEMILGTLALVAQEESANTSKRIKFSKKRNAENGKVPNFVFGYDKIPGDFFSLSINVKEAETVRYIFDLYVNEGVGAAKISRILNESGIKTKRGCNWSQNAVARILSNEIYIGKIVNGKEQIKDFLTGERIKNAESEWMVTKNDALRIIDSDLFTKAQNLMQSRRTSFKTDGNRNNSKHIFSSLIKCSQCGSSFRRCRREYKNVYVSWVCSGRNTHGTDFCANSMVVDENDLIEAIREYFTDILKNRGTVMKNVINEFKRIYNSKNDNIQQAEQLNAKISKLNSTKEKYMNMYIDNIISREDLNTKTKSITKEINELQNQLKATELNLDTGENLEKIINDTFVEIEDIVAVEKMTNEQIKRIIEKMTVFPDGTVDIFLKSLSDIGISSNVIFNSDRT